MAKIPRQEDVVDFYAGGPVRQPYAKVDFILQSLTMNLAIEMDDFWEQLLPLKIFLQSEPSFD